MLLAVNDRKTSVLLFIISLLFLLLFLSIHCSVMTDYIRTFLCRVTMLHVCVFIE